MSKLITVNGVGGKTTFSLILNKYFKLQNITTQLIHLDSIVCQVANDCDANINPSIHLGKFYNDNIDLVSQLAFPKILELLEPQNDIYIVEGIYSKLLNIYRREISPEQYVSVTVNKNEIAINNIPTSCDLSFDHPCERNVYKLAEYISCNVDAVNYFERLKEQSDLINKLLC